MLNPYRGAAKYTATALGMIKTRQVGVFQTKLEQAHVTIGLGCGGTTIQAKK